MYVLKKLVLFTYSLLRCFCCRYLNIKNYKLTFFLKLIFFPQILINDLLVHTTDKTNNYAV